MIFGAGFSQVGGSMKLNGLVSGVEGVPYDDAYAFMSTAPQIQIPKAEGVGYDVWYYLQDGWYDDGTPEGATKPGWCGIDGGLVDAEILAGQGVWLKGVSGAFTLTFAK